MRPSSRRRRDLLGDSLTSLCGGALAVNVLLVLALLGLLAANGLDTFWPRRLVELTLDDGGKLLGEIRDQAPVARVEGRAVDPNALRLQLKVGNRDLGAADFLWIDESRIRARDYPADAILLERLEWGNFFGRLTELHVGGQTVAQGPAEVLARLRPMLAEKARQRAELRDLEQGEIGDVNLAIEKLRLAEKGLARASLPEAERAARWAALEQEKGAEQARYEQLAARLFARREALLAETVVVEAIDGQTKELPVGAIVRAVTPNALSTWQRWRLYGSRLVEFAWDDPRESNTEGGIFPAIFGTVMMVFLMAFAVAPLGVLAALYLREYAKQGPLVRVVRIAVNNLAGVPSIVFGVFGLGFFVYLVGGSIDRLFYSDALPTPTFGTGGILWAALTLALLTVPVVIVATEEGLAAVPRVVREGSLALGATKFETTFRVVVPAAAPGILTGMILAMARAAGEVAPLMIVGMVKLAPTLPLDHHFPFVHLERKFMHLGFHIYDVGFQSPNVDASKPLVFATALLLILVVTATNLLAISLRNHLRRKYAGSAV